MSNEKDYNKVKQLVAEGNTEDAINSLLTLDVVKKRDLENVILGLRQRLLSIEKSNRLGVISHSNYSQEFNKINYSLL